MITKKISYVNSYHAERLVAFLNNLNWNTPVLSKESNLCYEWSIIHAILAWRNREPNNIIYLGGIDNTCYHAWNVINNKRIDHNVVTEKLNQFEELKNLVINPNWSLETLKEELFKFFLF